MTVGERFCAGSVSGERLVATRSAAGFFEEPQSDGCFADCECSSSVHHSPSPRLVSGARGLWRCCLASAGVAKPVDVMPSAKAKAMLLAGHVQPTLLFVEIPNCCSLRHQVHMPTFSGVGHDAQVAKPSDRFIQIVRCVNYEFQLVSSCLHELADDLIPPAGFFVAYVPSAMRGIRC